MANDALAELLAPRDELRLMWLGNLSWLIRRGPCLWAVDLDLETDTRVQPSPIPTLELAPHRGQAHNNLAIALARQGDLDGAIEHVRRALELDPDNGEAATNLKQLRALRKRRAARAAEDAAPTGGDGR